VNIWFCKTLRFYYLHRFPLTSVRFFAGADWTTKAPGFKDQSTWLHSNILQHLPIPPNFQGSFYDACPSVHLQPDTAVHLLQDIITVGHLEHQPGQDVTAYVSEWRRLSNSLQHVSVVQLIPFLMLCRLDPDLFPGIWRSLEQGDPTLLNGSLADIEEHILCEQAIQQSFNFTPNSDASALCTNSHQQSNPPNQNNSTVYPPQNIPF
jgi:hypothetical protein